MVEADQIPGMYTERLPESVIRLVAGLLAFTAHGAVGLWLFHQPQAEPDVSMAATEIMIELADIPLAVNTERDQVAPDPFTSQDSAPAQASEALPLDTEPSREHALNELLEDTPPPVAKDADQRPIPKRRKPSRQAPRAKEAEPLSEPQAASNHALEAQAQTTASDRNAAAESAATRFPPSQAVVTWQGRLMAHLERRKRYPFGARTRGETGVVYIRFRIDDAGHVLTESIARSSGFRELDNEVLSLVRRASPVPSPPADAPRTIIAPVKFSVG
jgi:protein TonB